MRGTELSGLGGEEDTQRKKVFPSCATTDRDRSSSSTCLSLSLSLVTLMAYGLSQS